MVIFLISVTCTKSEDNHFELIFLKEINALLEEYPSTANMNLHIFDLYYNKIYHHKKNNLNIGYLNLLKSTKKEILNHYERGSSNLSKKKNFLHSIKQQDIHLLKNLSEKDMYRLTIIKKSPNQNTNLLAIGNMIKTIFKDENFYQILHQLNEDAYYFFNGNISPFVGGFCFQKVDSIKLIWNFYETEKNDGIYIFWNSLFIS